jgi:hypothetical protein
MSLLRGQPFEGRPDRNLGEGETVFWEIMGFFGPKPPEIGLRGVLRRLIAEGRIAEAHITALHWDLRFDPGPQDEPPPPLVPRPRPQARATPDGEADMPQIQWRDE